MSRRMIRLPRVAANVDPYVSGAGFDENIDVMFRCRVPGQPDACINTSVSALVYPEAAEHALRAAAESLARTVGRRLVFGE